RPAQVEFDRAVGRIRRGPFLNVELWIGLGVLVLGRWKGVDPVGTADLDRLVGDRRLLIGQYLDARHERLADEVRIYGSKHAVFGQAELLDSERPQHHAWVQNLGI